MSIKYYDWLSHHSERRPNKIAITDLDNGRNIAYGELEKRAKSLACWLNNQNIQKGDRIAILMRNAPEFFEIQFACHKLGAICLPLNWRLTPVEISYILGDSNPSVLIYENIFRETIDKISDENSAKISLELGLNEPSSEYEKVILQDSDDLPVVNSSHDDVSMIMYTSGTTGNPKGALITHGMTFFNCVNLGIPALINANSVQFVALPLFHTAGLNCYANPILHAGGKVILSREFDPGKTLKIIGDPSYQVTHFMGVPAVFLFMMQHPDFERTDLSRIQQAGIGGAPCAEPILLKWLDRGVPLVQGWGMTETSPGGTGLDIEFAKEKIGSCGKPLLHTEIKIVDEKGKSLPHGQVGELLIKGPNITPGYWNNPEATASSFIDGWLKTGDAAKKDKDGFLYIIDRWKDMYISGGENVYPAEVENIIYQLPEVAEAAVIGVPDMTWGESGLATVVLKPEHTLSADQIIDQCKNNLAKFKVPKQIIFMDRLPRNATGKVLKRQIRSSLLDSN